MAHPLTCPAPQGKVKVISDLNKNIDVNIRVKCKLRKKLC